MPEPWGPVPLGEPVFVGMSYDAEGVTGVATIRDVRANIAEDTAGTKVEFFVCQVDAAAGIGSIGSIIGEKEINRECLSLVPAHEAKLGLGRHPMDQIVMGLFPTRPGRVTVRNIEVTYSRGWQTGTQRVGGRISLRTAS